MGPKASKVKELVPSRISGMLWNRNIVSLELRSKRLSYCFFKDVSQYRQDFNFFID